MDTADASFFELLRPDRAPFALMVLIVALVVARITTRTLDRLGERFTDKRLVISQVASFLRFLVYLIGGFAAVAIVLTPSREVWLAVGGTVAVSIGFALKDLVASIVAGLIILVDRPFQVGDRVTFDGYYGEIRHIGLRSVRLVTLDDTQVTIPNNKFLTDSVASGNAGAVEMMIQMDFWVGLDQDVTTAKRIVSEALTSSRYVSLALPWSVNLAEVIDDSYLAVRLRAKGYVLDVRFESAFVSDVTERVLEGFRDAAIAPPAVLHRSV